MFTSQKFSKFTSHIWVLITQILHGFWWFSLSHRSFRRRTYLYSLSCSYKQVSLFLLFNIQSTNVGPSASHSLTIPSPGRRIRCIFFLLFTHILTLGSSYTSLSYLLLYSQFVVFIPSYRDIYYSLVKFDLYIPKFVGSVTELGLFTYE